MLCRGAPVVTYEALQTEVQGQLGIGRDRLGGVLTSLAAARKRLPVDVDSPIQRDKELRRYRIEPVGAELLLGAINRARGARAGQHHLIRRGTDAPILRFHCFA